MSISGYIGSDNDKLPTGNRCCQIWSAPLKNNFSVTQPYHVYLSTPWQGLYIPSFGLPEPVWLFVLNAGSTIGCPDGGILAHSLAASYGFFALCSLQSGVPVPFAYFTAIVMLAFFAYRQHYLDHLDCYRY